MKTTRLTISVPADLRAAMDDVLRDHNWSALACDAFREAVERAREEQSRKQARLKEWANLAVAVLTISDHLTETS